MHKTMLVLGLLWSLLPTLLSAGAGPKINFAALEHDFGEVTHGQSPSVELAVTNTGDQDLILERISSSCGCARAIRGSRTVPPGSSSKIFAQIETSGMPPGRHFKTVVVHSNDPEHPLTTLKLGFTVVRHVSVQPDVLATSLFESDKEAVFSLKATNYWTEPITLKAAKTGASDEVLLVPQEVVVPPGGNVEFRLCVQVKREPPQAYVKGQALIETTDPLEKELPVRYFIRLPKRGGTW